MKKEFEVRVSHIRSMTVNMTLHVDAGCTLEELAEDLEYQASVKAGDIFSGNIEECRVVSRGIQTCVDSIKLLDEVKIEKSQLR